MQWSRIKLEFEKLLAQSLKGRVELHAARYRKFHDQPGRVWITFDKQEIFSACDTVYEQEHAKLYEQRTEENKLVSMPYHPDWQVMMDSPQRQALAQLSDRVEAELYERGCFSGWYLQQALARYLTQPLEASLAGEEILLVALAMLDRRLGKRRLAQLSEDTLHPVVRKFYHLRCGAENSI